MDVTDLNLPPTAAKYVQGQIAATANASVAYGRLRHATKDQATRKHRLKQAVAHALVNGEITGKNEAERDAAARSLLADSHQELHEAEAELADAKLALDQALLDLDLARFLAITALRGAEEGLG